MYRGKYTIQEQSKPAAEKQVATQTPPIRRRPRKKQTPKKGSKLFYSIYGLCVLAFFIILACLMNPLRDWLVKYEASQPGNVRDQVFSSLFENPDWEKIYTLAGMSDSTFENQTTFAAYMNQLVGDEKLTCLETSAGLSGDKKYIIKLKDQKIASFTLTNNAKENAETPKWQLDKLELFATGSQTVTVEKLPGQTVCINGIALDDSYTVEKTATLAEGYLPENLHGYQRILQQITGLLSVPEVLIKDVDGNPVTVTLNPETGVYTQAISTTEATEEDELLALDAVKAYAQFMIRKMDKSTLSKYFDPTSKIYSTIISSEVGWMQSYSSFRFTEPKYSDFYRYSDTMFSIFVDATLEVTRHNGSVKEYDLSNTLFFTKKANGKYLVTDMTNVNVQQSVRQVRLTFMNENTQLSSTLVDADAKTLTLPTVTAPEGKVFRGWVKQNDDGKGNITLTVVFEPSENQEVYLPGDYILEPMVLHALFEEAK